MTNALWLFLCCVGAFWAIKEAAVGSISISVERRIPASRRKPFRDINLGTQNAKVNGKPTGQLPPEIPDSSAEEAQFTESPSDNDDGLWLEAVDDVAFLGRISSRSPHISSRRFASRIFYTRTAWLVQIYADDSQASNRFSKVWESTFQVLRTEGGGIVEMGRVNYWSDKQLVGRLSAHHALFGLFPFPIRQQHLPVVIGFPPLCQSFSCGVRLRDGTADLSNTSVDSLMDFVGMDVLGLSTVPWIHPRNVITFMERAADSSVAGVAFLEEGSAVPFALRMVAEEFGNKIKVGYSEWNEAHAGEWKQTLGIDQPVNLVFVPGIGADAVGFAHTNFSRRAHFEQHFERYWWEAIPELHYASMGRTGCGLRPQPHSQLVDLCVVLLSPSWSALTTLRRVVTRRLPTRPGDHSTFAVKVDDRDYSVRIFWQHTFLEPDLCAYLLWQLSEAHVNRICRRHFINWVFSFISPAPAKDVQVVAYKPHPTENAPLAVFETDRAEDVLHWLSECVANPADILVHQEIDPPPNLFRKRRDSWESLRNVLDERTGRWGLYFQTGNDFSLVVEIVLSFAIVIFYPRFGPALWDDL